MSTATVKKANAAAVRNLAKLHGKLSEAFEDGSVFFAKDIPAYEIVSSGSLALDFAMGIGGLPSNRIIEICGGEGLGKSSLAFIIARNFLDAYPDKGVIVLDLEHKISVDWATQLIGEERMDRVLILWPDSAEEATDMYVAACKSGSVSVAIFDSIGGAPSQRVTDKSATIGNIGGNALAITRFAQLAAIHSSKYNVLTIGINQLRQDMKSQHGNGLATPGGNAWKHACIARIQLKRGEAQFFDQIGSEKIRVGYEIKAVVVKNQMAPPLRTAQWNFHNVASQYGGIGIDYKEEIIRLSKATGVVENGGGGYFRHPALPGGQVRGLPALIATVKADDALVATLTSEVMARLRTGDVDASAIAPVMQDLSGLVLDDEE